MVFLQSPELIKFVLSHRLGANIKELDIQARTIPPEIQNQVNFLKGMFECYHNKKQQNKKSLAEAS